MTGPLPIWSSTWLEFDLLSDTKSDMSFVTLRAIAAAFSAGHTASMVTGGLWKAAVAEAGNYRAFGSRVFSG